MQHFSHAYYKIKLYDYVYIFTPWNTECILQYGKQIMSFKDCFLVDDFRREPYRT